MNIVAGVFLDNTLQVAQFDRDLMVMEEMRRQEDFMKTLKGLFTAADENGDGKLSREEFKEILKDDWAKSFFVTLGLDMQDTTQLFELLDPNKEDEIDIEDFVQGAMRFKGQARSIDVCAILFKSKELAKTMEGLVQFVEEHFDKLDYYFHPDAASDQRIKHVMSRVGKNSAKTWMPRLRNTHDSSPLTHPRSPALFPQAVYMSPRVSADCFSNPCRW